MTDRFVGRGAMAIPAALLALAVLLFGASPASAQERIVSYDIDVAVASDGSLQVTERIRVRAEGSMIRRGIYRDFPTRYRDRLGNRMRVDFEVLGVERDGAPEPWFTEGRSNGVRVNTGNDDFLPVPAEYEFTLRYRTSRQLGFFAEHDELYWNAIGTGWEFPIETASVVVSLPEPVDPALLGVEAYTGAQGEQGRDYRAYVTGPGVARYETTRALAPFEGLTIVLTFPKGLVPQPTRSEQAGWFFRDNRGVLVALVGLVWLLLFSAREWQSVGRDPAPGVVIPRYLPNREISPGAHRYLRRMGYDVRCFSGDVLALAVAGYLKIHREDHRIRSDVWTLERVPDAVGDLLPAQRVLLGKLFPAGRSTLRLEASEATTVSGAHTAHSTALDRELHPRYFQRNRKSLAKAMGITAFTGVAAVLSSGGFAIPAIVAVLGAMLILIALFGNLVRAPTKAGRAALDEIEGLILYLSVAEKDELAAMEGPGARAPGLDPPPPLDADRYEMLLPYAVALEVEDAWTKKFTASVGAAAAAETASRIAWYSGTRAIGNLGSFSAAIGSSLSTSIASSSSPPGSSSGSGGGGSSGGGGGGGGGGGR